MPIRVLYKYKLKNKNGKETLRYLRRILQRRYKYGLKENDVNYVTQITILRRIYNREEEYTYWTLSEQRDERMYKQIERK